MMKPIHHDIKRSIVASMWSPLHNTLRTEFGTGSTISHKPYIRVKLESQIEDVLYETLVRGLLLRLKTNSKKYKSL